ncbi:MAG TPA: hypothetical protein VGO47_08005, partial [Chlamydiales bacterium]|nr:hypothetical protein [Chlamydiales bacterium]
MNRILTILIRPSLVDLPLLTLRQLEHISNNRPSLWARGKRRKFSLLLPQIMDSYNHPKEYQSIQEIIGEDHLENDRRPACKTNVRPCYNIPPSKCLSLSPTSRAVMHR